MSENFQNVLKIPELKKRILFTLAMLLVYRIGAYVPTPGIDGAALSEFFSNTQGTILGFIDMFTGGAFSRATIFALGIMPYISASIIMELLTAVSPHLESLKKEGEEGRKKITQYSRYGTVVLSIVQGYMISMGLEAMTSPTGAMIVHEPGWPFRLMAVLTLTSGTAFIMWLGEQITERGIGNGISLIIFVSIVVGLPAAVVNTVRLMNAGELQPFLVLILILSMAAVVWVIVFFETGQRRIPIQYAKRVVGRKMYGGQSSHLPLKVNTSGVIPPIFASSIIMFPMTIATFVQHPWMQAISDNMLPGTLVYTAVYIPAIFFFCYFYTAIIFDPADVADNMKKQGGFIPGIRPGQKTAEYIDKVLSRLTFAGAIYLVVICSVPDYLRKFLNVPFYFGGTGLLIIVDVALDTMAQIESHLVMRNYEGFMKKGKMIKR